MKGIRLVFTIAGVIIIIVILNFLLVHFESGAEGSSIDNLAIAFWYSIVTLSTVGYGDYTPISDGGRVIGYIYVFSSLGVIGFLFSTISNRIYTMIEEKKLGFYGTKFENHIVIVGWNEFSKMVADEISQTSKKMAIITNKKDDIDLIYEQYGKDCFFVLFAEYQNFESLAKVNASKASVAFISLQDDSDSLLYVLDFKKRYPQPAIVVSLQKSQLKETFKAAGVTYVIARSEIASKLVASYIFEPDVADMNIDLISTSRKETDFDIQEYLIKEENAYANKEYLDIFYQIKEKYDCILLGLSKMKNGERKLLMNPEKGTKVEAGDYVILMGNGIAKKQIQSDFKVDEGRG